MAKVSKYLPGPPVSRPPRIIQVSSPPRISLPFIHCSQPSKLRQSIHIGHGRFTLNLVTGWYLPEMEMFGITLLDHDSRYEMAEEWVQIATRLWTDPEPFDFNGRFYQMKKAELAPKPIQRPRPPLMSAAGSDRGRRFAAQYCDVCFIAPESYGLEQLKTKVDRYRDYAATNSGVKSRSGPTRMFSTATARRMARHCGITALRKRAIGPGCKICWK